MLVSLRATTWAWEQDVSPPDRKFVLLARADRANDNGYCWARVEKISARTGLNEGSVRRHDKALRNDDLVRVVERERKPDGRLGRMLVQLGYGDPDAPLPREWIDRHRPVDNGQPARTVRGGPARRNARRPARRVRAQEQQSLERTVNYPPKPPLAKGGRRAQKHSAECRGWLVDAHGEPQRDDSDAVLVCHGECRTATRS
jgi:hypothetical protein